jgi:hypothetical protein
LSNTILSCFLRISREEGLYQEKLKRFPGKTYMRRFVMSAAAVCLISALGCSRLDTRGPRQVGEAGWRAIAGNDIEALQKLAAPEDRHKFTADALRRELDSLPPFPDTIIVVMEITGERAQALVKGWEHPYGLQMEKKDRRWCLTW